MNKKRVTLLVLWILFMVSMGIYMANAQDTKLGFGAGVLEESNRNGNAVAMEARVQHDFNDHLGINTSVTWSNPRWGEFRQLRVTGNYNVRVDHSMNLKLNAGAARQSNCSLSGIYPTFGVDALIRTGDRTELSFSWAPVVRGDFRDVDTGWSHTVNVLLLIQI